MIPIVTSPRGFLGDVRPHVVAQCFGAVIGGGISVQHVDTPDEQAACIEAWERRDYSHWRGRISYFGMRGTPCS